MSLPTFRRLRQGQRGPKRHGVESLPPTPECLPAGITAALAAEEAAELCYLSEERPGPQPRHVLLAVRTQPANVFGADRSNHGLKTGTAEHATRSFGCKFLSMPIGRGPVWYPRDEGHGFRANGNVRHLTFEECEFRENHRLGIQLGGANVGFLSFVRCVIKDNKGAAVSGPGRCSALEWIGCTVEGNGRDKLPPGKRFGSKPPVAGFEVPADVRAGKPIRFVGTARAAHGEIAAVLWDFNDGVPSTEARPTHTYHKPGTYRVTLVV